MQLRAISVDAILILWLKSGGRSRFRISITMYTCVKKIIKPDTNACDNIYVIESDHLIYFTGFDGSLNKKHLTNNVNQTIIVILRNNEDRPLSSKVNILLSRDIYESIYINSEDYCLIVNETFFPEDDAPAISISSFSRIHDSLICELMVAINQSLKPVYLMKAIANLIAVEYREMSENTKFDQIVDIVKKNYLDDTFSLEALAAKAYMSRRKLQYILSEEKVSFLDLLNSYRLSHLKKIIKQNPSIPIGKLVSNSGFKSMASANRVANKTLNMTAKELKSHLTR